jgi:hypothetical protein
MLTFPVAVSGKPVSPGHHTGRTSASDRKDGGLVDSDRVEGKEKELEGKGQQAWGKAKDKVRDVWDDMKDKGEDLKDDAEDVSDDRERDEARPA